MKLDALFSRLAVNTAGRDFVVGDIHGQMAMLDRLLEMVDFDTRRDRLIALGDLVDRGPDGAALLERVRDQPWFYSLRGNHEAMMLEALSSGVAARCWGHNDNQWSRTLEHQRFKALCDVIRGLPLAIELPLADGRTVGLVHAEVRAGHTWDDLRTVVLKGDEALDDEPSTLAASALWGRSRIRAWAQMMNNPKAEAHSADRRFSIWQELKAIAGVDQVISGHSILAKRCPVAVGNVLFIDTGACETQGRMTLVEPLAGHYWQVASRSPDRTRAIRLKPVALPVPACIPEDYWPSAEQIERDRAINEARRRLTRIAGLSSGEVHWP